MNAVPDPQPWRTVVWVSLVVLASFAGARAESLPDSAADVVSISWWMANLPLHCARISTDHEICTWRGRKTLNVTCQVDRATGALAGSEPCVVRRDNEEMRAWAPTTHKEGKERERGEAQKRQLQRAAAADWARALTLQQVTRFVGVGPDRCSLGNELTCSWVAVRRTPGYIPLARLTQMNGPKIRILCRFPLDGANRGKDSCLFHVADQEVESAR